MDSVPGMSHMPQVTYRLQSPPPPLNGYVHGATSDADNIFRTKRPFCVSTDESAISLTSNRMFDIHYQAKQFTEMITAAVHLKSIREKALESLELQNQPDVDAFTLSQLLHNSSAKNAFIRLVDGHKSELDTPTKFESDRVNHVTPNWRKVDKVFAWGVVPYCETSHEGMKKVFYTLGRNFQMFDVDDDGRHSYLQPNADKRRIYLCVKALSAHNFWCLYANLEIKLTEIGTSDIVLPLLGSVE